MRYLFFDTETTGFPPDCRLVQLAALQTDEKGKHLQQFCLTVWNDEIPDKAVEVHGITAELSQKVGLDIDIVLRLFTDILDSSDLLIAYNINFDMRVLKIEDEPYDTFNELADKLNMIEKHDVMKQGKDKCKLEVMYQKLTGKELKDAHNAMADVLALKEIFFLGP